MVSNDAGLRSVKITDFGIAKMAEEELFEAFKDEGSTTGSQTAMGALPYMAPEIIQPSHTAGLPADIWAVGSMLYQFLTGDPPFGRGLQAVPNIVSGKLPERPVVLGAADQFGLLANELWEIVQRCLKQDPSARPSADELLEACSELCYSASPRRTGAIEMFRFKGGAWGNIEGDDGSNIFFHAASYYGSRPKAGRRVSFSAFPGSPNPRAFPVLPLRSEAGE
jgi:eukaryotic-like serine/threonine-protein kinase